MDDLNGWVIFLSIIATFIAILLTIIGFLLKYGIDTIRGDINSIWEWIKISDRDKLRALEEMATLKSEMKAVTALVNMMTTDMRAMVTKCSEMHMSGGKRWYDPVVRKAQNDEAEAGRS